MSEDRKDTGMRTEIGTTTDTGTRTDTGEIGRSAARKQEARDNPGPSPLRGIGVFGVIGWSVAVPTVAGTFLGLWLDRAYPQEFSWTIALILGGVVIGAALAWAWINKEKGE